MFWEHTVQLSSTSQEPHCAHKTDLPIINQRICQTLAMHRALPGCSFPPAILCAAFPDPTQVLHQHVRLKNTNAMPLLSQSPSSMLTTLCSRAYWSLLHEKINPSHHAHTLWLQPLLHPSIALLCAAKKSTAGPGASKQHLGLSTPLLTATCSETGATQLIAKGQYWLYSKKKE